MSKPKPEDISVILGRIRENAERIVSMHDGHQHCEDIDRAQHDSWHREDMR